jgi:light-regulated signal transduction histidine kinase (bacteriophytochrome)
MSQLLQDLLSYSLVSGGQLNFERVDLNQIVTEVLEDMRGTIEESGAGLSVSPLPVVSANPLQMRQMFQNLISNAIKYRKPGEHPNVRISTRGIKTPMGKRNSVWEVIVEDDGIGFDNEYAEKIFKLFERLHGHSEYDGTGVGLATALKIVQRHGWTIKAEGEPGVGAKFTILMISLEA